MPEQIPRLLLVKAPKLLPLKEVRVLDHLVKNSLEPTLTKSPKSNLRDGS